MNKQAHLSNVPAWSKPEVPFVLSLALQELSMNLPLGIIILDSEGQIMWANKLVAEILNRGDGLIVKNGTIRTSPELYEQCPLSLSIAEIKNSGIQPSVNTEKKDLLVKRSNKNTSYYIKISSFTRFDPAYDLNKKFILLHISDPDIINGIPEETVGRIFGLTKTESKIALYIAQGKSTKDCETLCSITKHTVRTHIKNIHYKTNVKSQSELTSMILSNIVVLYNDGPPSD